METQTIAEKPVLKPRRNWWRTWAARVATILAALGTFAAFAALFSHPKGFSEFAIFEHPWSSVPILIPYGVVLGRLLRESPSPSADGMQLGAGIAGAAFSFDHLLELLGFGAWAGEFAPTLGMLLLAALLNILMFRAALDVPLYLAWNRRARMKYLLNSILMFVVATGTWIVLFLAAA